jgi:type I restriction enzyme M protein
MTKEELKQLEKDLWSAADNLRANSDLKSSEYSTPVLGLIFLKFADNNYRRHEAEIIAEFQKLKGTRREKPLSEIAIEKCGFYLPDHARYDYLLNLPEEKDIAKELKEAMKSIEEYKSEFEGVLPKDEYARYHRDRGRSASHAIQRSSRKYAGGTEECPVSRFYGYAITRASAQDEPMVR